MSESPAVPPLILASASPRRAKLLRDAGYRFEQRTGAFDDSRHDLAHLPPHMAAPSLAYLKAASVADFIDAGIVIGADTLLSVDRNRIAKPVDADEVRSILTMLMGREHQVVTGVCLVNAATGRQKIFTDIATVTIADLDPQAIDAYIESGEWCGKAGGYNLAELEDRWRFDVRGDRTTVIGLPMKRLAEALEQFAPELDLPRATGR